MLGDRKRVQSAEYRARSRIPRLAIRARTAMADRQAAHQGKATRGARRGVETLISESTQSLLDGVPTFIVLSVFSAAPFIAFQTWIYRQFCLGEHERPWCSGSGLSYGWIQSEYW